MARKRGPIKTMAAGAEKATLKAVEQAKAAVRAFVEPPCHIRKNIFREQWGEHSIMKGAKNSGTQRQSVVEDQMELQHIAAPGKALRQNGRYAGNSDWLAMTRA
jgi:hypothetical protein